MFVFYDWPFPHVYSAKNVTYFPFNYWLSSQTVLVESVSLNSWRCRVLDYEIDHCAVLYLTPLATKL